jgi:ribosome-associated toxin RatA of RatAB toxin-antitoxin module
MPYEVAQIYAIVADVAAYPQFLPWCAAAGVLRQQGNEVEAEIVIAKGPVKVSFTTINQLLLNEHIHMRLKQGPFKQLAGSWTFEPQINGGCRVSLSLDFEFNNRLLAMTVGAVFEQVISSLIDAFLERAIVLYGNKDDYH